MKTITKEQAEKLVEVYRGGQHSVWCDGKEHWLLDADGMAYDGACSTWEICPNRQ